MENISHSLITLSRNDLVRKINASPGSLRKAISKFVREIAPKYECPYGLMCEGWSPNRNCIYWEAMEENFDYAVELEYYEDSYGFCPVLLDFIFFISDNLKKTEDFSKENHNCNLWTYYPLITGEYYESEFKKDKKISEKHYVMCVICGKERVRVN